MIFQELVLSKLNAPSHNSFPPIQAPIVPTIERPVCSFYLKTGVCRYDERFVDKLPIFLYLIFD